MPKAHFIGICGAGMSAVAKLLQDLGWEVGGSDEGFYPPASDYLIERGIPCAVGYRAENIPSGCNAIIIGKHAKLVPEDNEEVAAAFASGIPVKSFAEILGELVTQTNNYVVAGSFGKSTCTALTAWILLHAGKDPSYFVGALSPSLGDNSRAGQGKMFVLEGDEYPSANWDDTSKFLYYNPHQLLLTSCEHDHLNVFPTLESYLKPFKELVSLPNLRTIVACQDGANVEEVLSQTQAAVTTYSLRDAAADWYADNIVRSGGTTRFDVIHDTKRAAQLETRMLGEHNVQNLVGVAALLLGAEAVTPGELQAAVAAFGGVRRRLELKNPGAPTPVYEDFGSSRAKLLAGITAVRAQYPEQRLVVAFEPHTFSFRTRAALPWYDDLFAQADAVCVYQPPTHGAGSHDQLTQAEIVERIRASGQTVVAVADKEALLEYVRVNIEGRPSVVLIETSGGIGGAIPLLSSSL